MKILSFLKPYRIAVVVALFFMLVELAIELTQPLLIAKIIDEGIVNKDMNALFLWGAVMLGITIFGFTGGIINSFYSSHVSQSFGYDLRNHLYKKVQSFSFANFNQYPTSSLITRMTNDITQVQNTIFMGLRIMLRAPLMVIGGAIMALLVNVKLALFFIIVIPILILFLIWVMNKGGRFFRSVQGKLDTVNRVMQENLIAMRLIKALLRAPFENQRFTNAAQELKNKTVSAFRLMETTMPILLLVMNLSIVGILALGHYQINQGVIKVGEVVAIVNYGTRITGAFTPLSFIIMAFSRARASARRLLDVFNTLIDLKDSEQASTYPEAIEGQIEFKNVAFHYPNKTSEVLRNLSFKISPGQMVAVLGETGSGKSSLFQLIPRLYDVTRGAIQIDGQDIRELKLDYLRKQIGYVPQEALLFTGTMRENILWGNEQASMKEVINAAKAAQIHDTICRLPEQYDTILGQKGVNLSGGQKQRLSIARALVRQPRILMLDDSTSALDLKTEARLLNALRTYSCTLLIITQKISTALEADKILLLEEGKLVCEGKHEELLESSPLYQKIYHSQFGREEIKHA